MNSTSSLVLIAAAGPVTTLTLNRPEKRNALNIALLESLRAALTAAEADSTQRVLVLGGAGPVFCSGLDLGEANEPDAVARSAGLVSEVLCALATSRLVTIARVHGAAMAGGAGLMSACDFAIATRNTKFGFPEVRRGLVPALIMTLLRRQLQERDARELLLLGESFDAARAQAIGLINRVAADEGALDADVRSIVSSLLQGAPGALAETKRLFRELWPAPLADDLHRANAFHLAARNSAEAQEGIAAFNEKRPPSWAP
jgi:methylglutaconyl-CoA hydratase